jgi:hypothetical protein
MEKNNKFIFYKLFKNEPILSTRLFFKKNKLIFKNFLEFADS